MLLGIGVDIVHIPRILSILSSDSRGAFLNKVLTAYESNMLHTKLDTLRGGWLAKRFAAKEAFVKALGTGFGEGITFQDIEVRNTTDGSPFIICDKVQHSKLLSLSDDGEYAIAYVTIYDSQI